MSYPPIRDPAFSIAEVVAQLRAMADRIEGSTDPELSVYYRASDEGDGLEVAMLEGPVGRLTINGVPA